MEKLRGRTKYFFIVLGIWFLIKLTYNHFFAASSLLKAGMTESDRIFFPAAIAAGLTLRCLAYFDDKINLKK